MRALDLRNELTVLRSSGVAVRVIGCASDTLTPSEHCRELARLAGASYDELQHEGGHMWMLRNQAAFSALFAA